MVSALLCSSSSVGATFTRAGAAGGAQTRARFSRVSRAASDEGAASLRGADGELYLLALCEARTVLCCNAREWNRMCLLAPCEARTVLYYAAIEMEIEIEIDMDMEMEMGMRMGMRVRMGMEMETEFAVNSPSPRSARRGGSCDAARPDMYACSADATFRARRRIRTFLFVCARGGGDRAEGSRDVVCGTSGPRR